MVLISAQIVDFSHKSSGLACFENSVDLDQLCILVWILDCAFLHVQILGPEWILDHRSLFTLCKLMSSSKSVSLFEQS